MSGWLAARWATEPFVSHYHGADARPDVYLSLLCCSPCYPRTGINLSWQAGPDGLWLGHSSPSSYLLFLSTLCSRPQTSARPQPSIQSPMRPSLPAVVMLLRLCSFEGSAWSCFNVNCNPSVAHWMFAIFVALQVTQSYLLLLQAHRVSLWGNPILLWSQ